MPGLILQSAVLMLSELNVCHCEDGSTGTTCTCQLHKQADPFTAGMACLPHKLLPASLSACPSLCPSVCCSAACVVMNEPPSMAREAPLFKVTALSKLSHLGELPSHPSRRTGHTCARTRTCTDELAVGSDRTNPCILTGLQTQACSHAHSRLALLAGSGQPSGLLAGRQ